MDHGLGTADSSSPGTEIKILTYFDLLGLILTSFAKNFQSAPGKNIGAPASRHGAIQSRVKVNPTKSKLVIVPQADN